MHKVTVRGVISWQGELLMQKLHNVGHDCWVLPGGKLEEGESIYQGLQRELLEECGVQAELGELLCVNEYFDGTHHVIAFLLHVKNPQDFLHLDLAATTHGQLEVRDMKFIRAEDHDDLLPANLKTMDIHTSIAKSRPVVFDCEL